MQRKSTLLTKIVRSVFPRNIRNALRRPKVSLQRMRSQWQRMLGATTEIEVLPGWSVRCHPICADHFEVFHKDPEQALELNSFVRHASPGMQFVDVGTHWGIFTLAAFCFGGRGGRALSVSKRRAKPLRCSKTISHSTR